MTDDRRYGDQGDPAGPEPTPAGGGAPRPDPPDRSGDGTAGFEAPGYRPPAEGDGGYASSTGAYGSYASYDAYGPGAGQAGPPPGYVPPQGAPGYGSPLGDGSPQGAPGYGAGVGGASGYGGAYGGSQHGGPPHGGPPHGGPQYGEASYSGPQYGGPQYGGPQYGDASYGGSQSGGPGGYGPVSQPGIVPLRPLGVSEILSGAFAAIRFNPRTILGYSAAFHAVALVVLLVGQLVVLLAADGVSRDVRGVLIELPSTVTSSVMSLVSTILAALIILPVVAAVRGRRLTLGETWAQVRGRIPTILALMVLGFVVTCVAILLVGAVIVGAVVTESTSTRTALILTAVLLGLVLAIGGAILSVYLTFTWAVVTAERLGPLQALRRSAQLVRGAFWRTFGIELLASFIVGAASMVATIPVMLATTLVAAGLGADTDAGAMTTTTVTTILTLVVQALTVPFSVGVTSLLYVDRRIRTEGYALELVGADPQRGW